jgi:hypothetical protein
MPDPVGTEQTRFFNALIIAASAECLKKIISFRCKKIADSRVSLLVQLSCPLREVSK